MSQDALAAVQAAQQFHLENVQIPVFAQTLANRGYETKSAADLQELLALSQVLTEAAVTAKEAGADQVTSFYQLAKEAALVESGAAPAFDASVQREIHTKVADALIEENQDVFNTALSVLIHQLQPIA